MDFFSAMEVVTSSLTAQRVRMNTTASNLANANTTRTENGGPYRRRDVVFKSTNLDDNNSFQSRLEREVLGVEISEVREDQKPPKLVYDPGHPDANGDGYVAKPNVSGIEEMVNMTLAARSYEAGVTAMKSLTEMAQKALAIGR